jgi:polysaccharide pyruvyl transferase CsaB
MKSILLSGYYGFGNLGDELILKNISRLLEDIGIASIYAVSGNVEYSKTKHNNITFVDRDDYRSIVNIVRDVDLVALGGGGLFQDHYPLETSFLFETPKMGIHSYINVPLIARIYKKPIAYLFQGAGPLFSEDSRNFTRYAYTLPNYISVRDDDSARLLEELGIRNAVLTADPVFLFPLDINRTYRQRPKIGISIRQWVDRNVEDRITNAVTDFMNTAAFDCDFYFLSFQDDDDSNSDTVIYEKIKSGLKSGRDIMLIRSADYSLEEIESSIADLDCVIGMRLHSAALAIKYKIPFLAIPYSDKVRSLLKDAGLDDLLISIEDISGENINNKLVSVIEQSSDVKERIDKGLSVIHQRLQQGIETLQDFFAHKAEIRNQLTQTIADIIAEKDNIRNQLTAEKDSIYNQLNYAQGVLNSIYSSDFWRVASWYYRMRDSNYIIKAVHRILKRFKHLLIKPKQIDNKLNCLDQKDYLENLRDFISKNKGKSKYIVYAAVKFTDTEGQRSVRLSQALNGLGNAVIFVYWNWSEQDKDLSGEVADGLFAIPRDDFLNNNREILKLVSSSGDDQNILLIEFSDPDIIPALIEANSLNFVTIYDILDNWEEFNKVGQAVWYDGETELFILRNTTYRFAVTNSLIKKFQRYEIHLLPNGFDPEKLKDNPRLEVEKGETTIGYFGHLTNAWFDWDLLIETAESNSPFMFHIIGYGIPSGLKLPRNIKYLGKVHPNDLSSYVINWDVCIIPFKDDDLSKSADPVKVYEYLYFKKPVIVTGLSHLSGYPYVIHSQNNSQLFRDAILEAKRIKVDNSVVAAFLKDKSWLERTKSMLKFMSGA